MHYDFYKNTASHNTLMLGEENQSPVNGELTRYEEQDGVIYVEAGEEQIGQSLMKCRTAFTIVQWWEEEVMLAQLHMKRKITWKNQYFVEVFLADGIPRGKSG